MGTDGDYVSLERVWVAYAGSDRPAIADVSLRVGAKNLIHVTGPNGAGKTTLLETCLGLLKPLRGKALLFGVDTRRRDVIRARRMCSYVPQNFMRPPYEHYTAKQVALMGLCELHKRIGDLRKDIESYARELGISDLMDRPIGALSGGQQQKVFLLRAFLRSPKLLLLDEPFSSLDYDSRFALAEILKEYVDENHASVILVSHVSEGNIFSAGIKIVMERGRIVS